jgi:hypothetical protein
MTAAAATGPVILRGDLFHNQAVFFSIPCRHFDMGPMMQRSMMQGTMMQGPYASPRRALLTPSYQFQTGDLTWPKLVIHLTTPPPTVLCRTL